MCKEIWGPNTKPFRQIRDMWNSLPPFLDYRGVMFGINDTTEKRPADQDQAFDLAYYLYHDPVYAGAAKKAQKRSLLYGMDDLPEKTPDVSSLSAYADNAGVAMLRSQTPNRPQSDQIQAVLRYGTDGWAHGHFDRTDLLSLMRYGRSFYNPEMIWYSYEPFMYKFYVQTSVNHNMVVVDQKMQEPVESKRLLFYSGKPSRRRRSRRMLPGPIRPTAEWSTIMCRSKSSRKSAGGKDARCPSRTSCRRMAA